MLNGGIALDSAAGWNAWPKDLPVLIYHGEDDPICDSAAAKRFGQNVVAEDKTVEIFPVSLVVG
jgi:acylglycerol lipase